MEEIKVGEYVRTRKGIAKIKEFFGLSIRDKKIWKVDKNGTLLTSDSFDEFIQEEDIIEHSFNIIDLIKLDDFVKLGKNCYPLRVECIWKNGEELDIELEGMRQFEDIKNNKDFKIYSVVTKEQIKQIEYRIKE